MSTVLMAMSGGVDSSISAHLLLNAGYNVQGIMLKLIPDVETFNVNCKTCCSANDSKDARLVADRLGIDFRVLNYKDLFQSKVIDRFIQSYLKGLTPNPCVDCNKYIKFGKLFDDLSKYNCELIATGHYTQIEKQGDRFLLKKAEDLTKDQTYFLYALTQEQLSKTIFPLGKLKKTEVREIAANLGLINAKKRESQDICFVPDGNYAKLIGELTPGNFIDKSGKILGTHDGISSYTIGQRKGLGLSFSKPKYVIDINAKTNEVTIDDEEYLFSNKMTIKECSFSAFDKLTSDLKANVRIRYSAKEQPARLIPVAEGEILVEFDEEQRAITKGQSAVIYSDDYCLGGGIIS